MFGSTLIEIVAVLSAFVALATSQIVLESPTEIQQSALNTHNEYRTRHRVLHVSWREELAAHAQSVSDSCVRGHDIMEGTGQNIAYGYPSMQAAIDAWYDEVSDYNYDTGEPIIRGLTTGHFTQVVWRGTSEIGCAATYCTNFNAIYYVCDYSPPGNYVGQYTSNVFRPLV